MENQNLGFVGEDAELYIVIFMEQKDMESKSRG